MGFSARKLSAFDSRYIRVGNNIPINGLYFSLNALGNAIAFNSTIQIPDEQQPEPVIKVFSLNGGVWNQVGTDILRPQDPSSLLNISSWGINIKINSNGNVIAFNYLERIQSFPLIVQYKTRVLTWNGSNWIQLGSDIVSPESRTSSFIEMSANSSCDRLFICYRYFPTTTSVAYKNSVFSWNGSSWNQIGSDINAINVARTSMNAVGDRVAVSLNAPDSNTWYGALRVFSFNGSSWIQTGATITGTPASQSPGYDAVDYIGSIALNSSGDILSAGYNTGANNDIKYVRFFSFNGSSWIQIRQDLNIITNVDVSSNWSSGISLLSNGNTIAYYENNSFNSERALQVYTWNSSRWIGLFGNYDTGSNLQFSSSIAIQNSLENYVAYTKNNNIIVFKLLNK